MPVLVGQEGVGFTDTTAALNTDDWLVYFQNGYAPVLEGLADTAFIRIAARNEASCVYYIGVYEFDGEGLPTLIGQSAEINGIGNPISAAISPTIPIVSGRTYYLGVMSHIPGAQDGRLTFYYDSTALPNRRNNTGTYAAPPTTINPSTDTTFSNEISIWLEGEAGGPSVAFPVLKQQYLRHIE